MDALTFIPIRMGIVMSATGNGWQSIQSIKKRKLKEKRKEVEFLLIKEGMMQDGTSLPRHLSKNILSVQFADNLQKYATTKIFQPMLCSTH